MQGKGRCRTDTIAVVGAAPQVIRLPGHYVARSPLGHAQGAMCAGGFLLGSAHFAVDGVAFVAAHGAGGAAHGGQKRRRRRE